MRILIVEDEVKIRQGLRAIIEDVIPSGCLIREASNGKEALEWLKTQDKVDLLITDIRMNEMNGIDLMKRVKPLYPGMSIIVISGHDEFVYAKEAIRYGALDYLLKPVDRVELANLLNRVKEECGLVTQNLEVNKEEGERAEKGRLLIRQVKEIVHQSLDQDISLQFLADRVYLHPKYLSDIFKRETGQNLSDYVTEKRMEKARRLLQTTTLKIADISLMCGFANHKYFASIFKQQTGCTPTEYRDQ
ncbi:response regulator [Paenibacillus sp. HWE-109]|uniref:response regulator transcription factor n=1 Tax=Paenibacillus sp. HWE-109 TaxID=1306526 RepID=UPI001EDDCFA6|nr:response regulator [Paenibacillus sp. HWE-109]UKS24848.1 response regulator [Paenibacillus sp. HWE-109]